MKPSTWLSLFAVVAGTAVMTALSWETRAGTIGNQTFDHVYVTSPNDGTVTVVDRLSMTQVNTIFTGGSPRGIAVLRDGTCAFVANGSGRLQIIDTATQSVEETISLGSGETEAWDVVVTPDGTKAYVTLPSDGDVSVVDLVGHDETSTISLPFVGSFGPHPRGIAMTPDGTRAFVVDESGSRVYAIDTETDQLVGDYAVDVQFGAQEIGVSGDGSRAIVIGGGQPVMFNTATGSLVETDFFYVGDQADVSVIGDLAYVTNRFFGFPTKQKGPRAQPSSGPSIDIYRFSTASYEESQALLNGQSPEGIAAYDAEDLYVCQAGFENQGTLLDFDSETESDGGSAPTGTLPWRATVVRTAETSVVSFFLPTIVNMKLAGAGKDFLATGGLYDDGNLPADYTEPVTIEVGGFSRTFTLVPNRKQTVYSFKDGVINLNLVPNLRGSSRGRFKLSIQKTTLQGLVSTDGPVEIRFSATGLPDAAGTVVLEKGRYRRAKKRGALLAPAFFAGLGQFTLKGADLDSCIVRWGFSAGGSTPATLGDVRIGIGALDMTVPGTSFVRNTKKGEDSFLATVVDGKKKVTISLDYKRELARVVAKNVELGDLQAGAATEFVLDPGNGAGVFRNRVRLGGASGKVFY